MWPGVCSRLVYCRISVWGRILLQPKQNCLLNVMFGLQSKRLYLGIKESPKAKNRVCSRKLKDANLKI